MQFTLKIQPEVIQDLAEGLDWYRNSSRSTDEQFFLEELEQALLRVKANPYYQLNYEEVRCYPLENFPFAIHFSVDESKTLVVVHALLSNS